MYHDRSNEEQEEAADHEQVKVTEVEVKESSSRIEAIINLKRESRRRSRNTINRSRRVQQGRGEMKALRRSRTQ